MSDRKLEFYGGEWMAFLPFVIFLSLILLTTFFWGSISDGALWVPAFLALIQLEIGRASCRERV